MHRLWLLILALTVTLPALATENFSRYDSFIEVKANGDLIITETIDYDLRLDKQKRGIYRDFPTKYYDRNGNVHNVGFEFLSATRDGEKETVALSDIYNGVRIRLGQVDHFLRRGIHRYKIKYRTNRQLIFAPDRVELYFNAIGHGWDFTIAEGSATVLLPSGARINNMLVWTGREGSRESNARPSRGAANEAQFDLTRKLQAYEGMTISVSWQPGIVAAPSFGQRFGWFMLDYRTVLMAVVGLFLVIAYYLYAWSRVGRDPKRGTVIALFEPPGGPVAGGLPVHHGPQVE